ncbi:Carbonic anhydrase or acetyltransferase, isoleucine patch superfamily [Chryseobacterium soldanellicola]|uniref:Carbonic anhydrase or acetyltransferase, isoleucine patch superfamily n=1 Tax=Chryseobacterium soldanellicola TaxID=311333 RepID=A0A1H1A712_9FLAO|nr:acyltransferase [Chryseobacterium soldanellicola]SDQ35291.1 Carbonic anhydrase or acetyltransferase, isoleucine patch superfamily [Chryseobacterium soldanellicola]
MKYKVHNLADVQCETIGENTTIWQFCVILKEAKIGKNCNINCNVFIENDVVIGDNVTIKPGVQVWDGVTLEDNVFIGPNVTFTNDLIPRSKQYPVEFSKTLVKKGASIGANTTVIAGNTIGENALIGAGSVITKDIPANTVWFGNPAKHTGYITPEGKILNLEMTDKNGDSYQFLNDEFSKK